MSEQTIALRGREAQQILDSEVFKESMAHLRSEMIRAIESVPDDEKDDSKLRRLQMMLKMSKKFESIFIGLVHQGINAQRKIDDSRLRDESKPRQYFRKIVNS